jgi:hypothetical protein
MTETNIKKGKLGKKIGKIMDDKWILCKPLTSA